MKLPIVPFAPADRVFVATHHRLDPHAFRGEGWGSHRQSGFSSTRGVQISLARFDKVTVNSTARMVEPDAGLTWDQVYAALDPFGISVIGGRVRGVGVSGLTLGGGISFKSNKYGLSIDNVVSYELVLPNETITSVTSKDKDLWFGLRGGLNDFVRDEIGNDSRKLKRLTGNCDQYQQKQDVNAALAVFLNYASGQMTSGSVLFYDASVFPHGRFNDFLAIPTTLKNCTWGAVTQYSPAIFDAFVNQTLVVMGPTRCFPRQKMQALLPILSRSTAVSSRTGPGLHVLQIAVLQSLIGAAWTNASIDGIIASALRKAKAAVQAVAAADEQCT
ncbi:hypothetical protein EDB86DRAFT_3106396 [Lactarius hatsudake]|nr:hypothetical protein EDB86DRAFT_3106396 [Lactarius hatsudake]